MSHIPTQPSSPRRRWLSFVWLLGVAVLSVSMAGAGWMMRSNAGPSAGGLAASDETVTALLHCIGHVDVKDGVTYPYPAAAGRVVEVKVEEGQEVKAGAVLFCMDDRAVRKDVERAAQAVAAGQLDIEKAGNAGDKHAQLVLAQQQAIEAARRDVDAARIAYEKKRDLLKSNNALKEDVEALEKLKEKAEFAVKAEAYKLEALKRDAVRIELEARSAEAALADRKLLLDKAKLALDECLVTAPADGLVLRLGVQKGDLLAAEAKSPPLIFCPAGPRIVRAEVEQEWAGRAQLGQLATIHDETGSGNGPTWTGKVVRLGDWMARRRSILPDPAQFHDIRTLECIVALDPGQPPVRIGQRVRVALSNP
jgi:multidrug resistance efflux pump